MSFPHALAGWGVSMAGICFASVGVLALVAFCTVSVTGQQTQTTAADSSQAVSFLAPGRVAQIGALQPLGGTQGPRGRAQHATTPAERGFPTWGAYLTPTDDESSTDGPTRVILRPCM